MRDADLHEVHHSVKFEWTHRIKIARAETGTHHYFPRKVSLITEVMDGEHGSSPGKRGSMAIKPGQVRRNQTGLMIVAMENVESRRGIRKELHDGALKENPTVGLIRIVISGRGIEIDTRAVEETIAGLQELGNSAVLLQPIGFVCDHVEVLYDIDIAFRKFAAEKGMGLWRAKSLNDSPLFIKAVADVARVRIQAFAQRSVVG